MYRLEYTLSNDFGCKNENIQNAHKSIANQYNAHQTLNSNFSLFYAILSSIREQNKILYVKKIWCRLNLYFKLFVFVSFDFVYSFWMKMANKCSILNKYAFALMLKILLKLWEKKIYSFEMRKKIYLNLLLNYT